MRPLDHPQQEVAPFGVRLVLPLALGSTLNPLNSTMISTALVPIASDFHASVAKTGWLIAGLYLASAIAQPTMGRLADLYGPRRTYLWSLVLIAVAGLLGDVVPDLGGLVMVRVLLGVGTSGAYPAAMRIFRVQADRLGREPPRTALGVLAMSGISMSAVGPFFGGVLTSRFGWHSIFTANVPVALATILLVLLWVPKDQPPARSGRLVEEVDLAGIGLFAGSLLSLMVFLLNPGHPVWLALPVAAVLGAGLVAHSRRRDKPFIDIGKLARNRPLTLTFLRAGLVLMIAYCVMYGFAQWLESAAGFSEEKAGLVTLPMSVVAAASSLVGSRERNVRTPFLVSIGAGLIGCIGLTLLDAGTSVWLMAAAVVFFGPLQGMFFTATQAAVYVQSPAEDIGTNAGLQRMVQYVGAIAAAGLLGLVYGQKATAHGLHSLGIAMGAIAAALFVWTVLDRTVARTASSPPAQDAERPRR